MKSTKKEKKNRKGSFLASENNQLCIYFCFFFVCFCFFSRQLCLLWRETSCGRPSFFFCMKRLFNLLAKFLKKLFQRDKNNQPKNVKINPQGKTNGGKEETSKNKRQEKNYRHNNKKKRQKPSTVFVSS